MEELDVAYVAVPEVAVAPQGTPEPDGIAALRVVRGTTSLGFYPVPADIPLLGTGVGRSRPRAGRPPLWPC